MTSYRQFSSRGLAKRSALRSNLRIIRRRWQMYVMFLVPFLWVLVFNYVPMYGVQIAFKDFIASNGTLYNMKFHPTALAGVNGLENFVALVQGYFDRKGSHMQFNVVSRETLRDAQKHPENYSGLVVRVAGYSALFTTLSRSLQEDIINRTEQGGI